MHCKTCPVARQGVQISDLGLWPFFSCFQVYHCLSTRLLSILLLFWALVGEQPLRDPNIEFPQQKHNLIPTSTIHTKNKISKKWFAFFLPSPLARFFPIFNGFIFPFFNCFMLKMHFCMLQVFMFYGRKSAMCAMVRMSCSMVRMAIFTIKPKERRTWPNFWKNCLSHFVFDVAQPTQPA